MTHYALTRVVGVGSAADPFRPPTDQETFSTIDLRPDASAREGFLLLATPERQARAGLYLGQDPDELSPAVARELQARLGVTLDADPTLAELVAELLLVHGREDGSRWRPLRPGRRLGETGLPVDHWEINLGGQQLWARDVPTLTGAARYTEDFNKSNSTTVGPDLTWVEQNGSWTVTSNRLAVASGQGDAAIFADAPLAGDDHYAEVDLVVGTDDYAGPTVRNRYPVSGGRNHYVFDFKQSANTVRLMKRVNDTLSTITTAGKTNTLPIRLRLEVEGSRLTGFTDGEQEITATDTSLAGSAYVRGGVTARASVESFTFDNFEVGDLQAMIDLTGSVAPRAVLVKDVPKVLAGSTRPAGLATFQRIVLRLFGGTLAGAAAANAQYPLRAALTRGLEAVMVSNGLRGGLERAPMKLLTGSATPGGRLYRHVAKVLTGQVRLAATLARSPVRIFTGAIAVRGESIMRRLGRIFGRPGIVALSVRVLGEVRSRVRRG